MMSVLSVIKKETFPILSTVTNITAAKLVLMESWRYIRLPSKHFMPKNLYVFSSLFQQSDETCAAGLIFNVLSGECDSSDRFLRTCSLASDNNGASLLLEDNQDPLCSGANLTDEQKLRCENKNWKHSDHF